MENIRVWNLTRKINVIQFVMKMKFKEKFIKMKYKDSKLTTESLTFYFLQLI